MRAWLLTLLSRVVALHSDRQSALSRRRAAIIASFADVESGE